MEVFEESQESCETDEGNIEYEEGTVTPMISWKQFEVFHESFIKERASANTILIGSLQYRMTEASFSESRHTHNIMHRECDML